MVEVFALRGYDASSLVFVSLRFEKMYVSHLQRSKCLLRTFRPSKCRTTNTKRCSVISHLQEYLDYLGVNLCEYRPGFLAIVALFAIQVIAGIIQLEGGHDNPPLCP
jgi:hypothetical protein